MKPLKIDIPKPCHEDWQEMTPIEQGRFCDQCAKTVYDFSGYSTSELGKKISSMDGNFCARIPAAHLNTNLNVSQRYNFLTFSFSALILSASLLTAQNTYACDINQINTAGEINLIQQLQHADDSLNLKTRYTYLTLNQADSSVAPFCKITFYQKKNLLFGLQTDFDGRGLIDLSKSEIAQIDSIRIENFESFEKTFAFSKTSFQNTIYLQSKTIDAREIEVLPERNPSQLVGVVVIGDVDVRTDNKLKRKAKREIRKQKRLSRKNN